MVKPTNAKHAGPVLLSKGGYDIIDCEICGFAHCLPIPCIEELERVYGEEYYSVVKPEYVTLVEKDRDWHERTFSSRLKELESLVAGRRMLEIGSGPGLFLEMARNRGWDVTGFEPSRQAWLYSTEKLGLPVRNEFFTDETAKHIGLFDAAYLGLVLEHLPEPASIVALLREVLAPGAVICVVAPNDFSPIQRFLAEERGFSPWWVAPPHHLNYFNHKSLSLFLERLGFSVKKATSTFPMDLFLLMGLDYTQDKALGRKCHGLRMRFEQELAGSGLEEYCADMYELMAKHNIGREAVLYAVRS